MRNTRARLALLSLPVVLAVSAPAVRANLQAISDKSIEGIVKRLKPPENLDEIVMPPDRAARAAELEAATGEAKSWESLLGPRAAALVEATPRYVDHLVAIHRVALDPAERKALKEQGLAALESSKAGPFEAAAETFTGMKADLASYFEAYDKYQVAEIKVRILGASLALLDKRDQLATKLSPDRLAKLDAALAEYLRREKLYRAYAAWPKAKNHHRALTALVATRSAASLTAVADAYMRKTGLLPKEPFGKKLRNVAGKVKQSLRLAKIGAACLPALGKMLAYLYNPFRKGPNDQKATDGLRFISKSYRWAAGMKVEIVGKEKVPTDHPVIFALSHRSELEDAVVMMGALTDKASFMVGQWALPSFLNDKLAEEPTMINVEGTKPDGTPINAVEEGIETIQDGRDLFIFPEGMTPTDQKETQPLRGGIDLIANAVMENPVSIVPVTIDDPANGYEDGPHKSLAGKTKVTVTFGSALDPLRIKAVPGADAQLVLDTIRAVWHRNLYRRDVDLTPGTSVQDLGVMPADQAGRFEDLHEGE